MVFWTIEYGEDRLSGWQIMDSTLSNAVLYDEYGNVLTGGFDYKVVGASDTPPSWWVG
jgi:hypothetical protein